MEREIKKIKSASEALELAKSKAIKIDEILELITTSANAGNTFTTFLCLIDEKAERELKDMGFMFGTLKDPAGQKMTKISWLD